MNDDPYKLMMINKENVITDAQTSMKWPEADLKKLKEFCEKQGIPDFDCGIMPPLVALSMLKQKLGLVDGIPSESAAYSAKNRYGDKFLLKG